MCEEFFGAASCVIFVSVIGVGVLALFHFSDIDTKRHQDRVLRIEESSSYDFQGLVTFNSTSSLSSPYVRVLDGCIEVHTASPDRIKISQNSLINCLICTSIMVGLVTVQYFLMVHYRPSQHGILNLLMLLGVGLANVIGYLVLNMKDDSFFLRVQRDRRTLLKFERLGEEGFASATQKEIDFLMAYHLKKFSKRRGGTDILDDLKIYLTKNKNKKKCILVNPRDKKTRFWPLKNLRAICRHHEKVTQCLVGDSSIDFIRHRLLVKLDTRKKQILNIFSKASTQQLKSITTMPERMVAHQQYAKMLQHIETEYAGYKKRLLNLAANDFHLDDLYQDQLKALSQSVATTLNKPQAVSLSFDDPVTTLLSKLLGTLLSIDELHLSYFSPKLAERMNEMERDEVATEQNTSEDTTTFEKLSETSSSEDDEEDTGAKEEEQGGKEDSVGNDDISSESDDSSSDSSSEWESDDTDE